MGAVIKMADSTLTRAVVIWTGWGRTSWPDRDDEKLISEFGRDVGLDLLQAVRRLEHDFYSSDARFTVVGLALMGERAADEFRARHPEVGEGAVQALKWCYTYDFK